MSEWMIFKVLHDDNVHAFSRQYLLDVISRFDNINNPEKVLRRFLRERKLIPVVYGGYRLAEVPEYGEALKGMEW